MNERKWGTSEVEALEKGLKKHGVGQWRAIREEFLPSWDEPTLRIKTCRRIGCQDLSRYRNANWKGGKDELDKEYRRRAAPRDGALGWCDALQPACYASVCACRNKQVGETLKCWKGGMLVENDGGDVAAFFRKLDEKKAEKLTAGGQREGAGNEDDGDDFAS